MYWVCCCFDKIKYFIGKLKNDIFKGVQCKNYSAVKHSIEPVISYKKIKELRYVSTFHDVMRR